MGTVLSVTRLQTMQGIAKFTRSLNAIKFNEDLIPLYRWFHLLKIQAKRHDLLKYLDSQNPMSRYRFLPFKPTIYNFTGDAMEEHY